MLLFLSAFLITMLGLSFSATVSSAGRLFAVRLIVRRRSLSFVLLMYCTMGLLAPGGRYPEFILRGWRLKLLEGSAKWYLHLFFFASSSKSFIICLVACALLGVGRNVIHLPRALYSVSLSLCLEKSLTKVLAFCSF